MESLYSGRICDPHIHLFPLKELSFEWLSGPNQAVEHCFLKEKINNIRNEYVLSDLINDSKKHNVTKFVHIQAYCSSALDEAKYCNSVAMTHPQLGATAAFADLSQESHILNEHLQSLAQLPKVCGVRQLLNYHDQRSDLRETPRKYEQDSQWIENLALLEKYGLHYEYHVLSNQLHSLQKIATQYPNLPFVINHCGLPVELDDNTLNVWRKDIQLLGSLPNVYMKISGLYMVHHDLPQQKLNEIVEDLIQAFSTEKVMFASNYPIEKAVLTYDELYTKFKVSVAHRSEDEQRKMFYDNAMKFYRLEE
jgi:predicted TIM-barrel fold metal-dependent hydrolase